MHGGEFGRRLTEFLAWLKHHDGVSISPKLAIADLRSRGAGRGVVALKDIEEGEELFTIPHTAILSVSNSDLGKQIPKDLDKLEPWLRLVFVMISESCKGPESKWWPYLEMLPDELDTLAYWSPDELAELQGSAVISKIGKEEADKSFSTIWKLAVRNHKFFGKLSQLFGAGKGSDDFKRMGHRVANIIMAYAFDIMPTTTGDGADEDGYISDDEESYPKGMVPFADMLNADGDKNNARLFQDDTSLTMTAVKPIAKGEEIFNDYGSLPRADLLRRYGYITDQYKKWDVVEMNMEDIIRNIPKVTNLSFTSTQKRCDYLLVFEDWEDTYDISRHDGKQELTDDIFDQRMIDFLGVLIMTEDEFKRFLKRKSSKISLPRASLDGKISEVLQYALTSRLEQYTTSIDEDRALLKDPSLPRRKRMAIEVRLGEKEILQQALSYLWERHRKAQEHLPQNDTNGTTRKRNGLHESEADAMVLDRSHFNMDLSKRKTSDESDHVAKRRKS